MNFNNKHKLQSRIDTIINPYRQKFSHTVPEDKQYWTMCANCTIEGSEYHQMVSSGLITNKQFFGVDHNFETIQQNKQIKDATFIHGDFFNVMASYKDFNPGIVNLDCLNTFATEKNNIKEIFFLLQNSNQVLFNINILLGNYNVKHRCPSEFINFITSDNDMVHFITTNNWKPIIPIYMYKGLGSTTKMFSIGLIKT